MPSTKPHPRWCIFMLSAFLHPPMHAKHETTPMLVCFRARHLSYPSNGCQARNHTLVGVFSCSAPFLCPPMHAEHETTPSLVCFCLRHLSYTLRCAARGVYPLLFFFQNDEGACFFVEYLYIIIYIFISNIIYLNIFSKSLRVRVRESQKVPVGTHVHRHGCGSTKGKYTRGNTCR